MTTKRSDSFNFINELPSPRVDNDLSLLQLLSVDATAKLLGIGVSTVRKYVSDEPGFPQPVRISRGRIGFLAAEVRAWLEWRVDERDRAMATAEEAVAEATAKVAMADRTPLKKEGA